MLDELFEALADEYRRDLLVDLLDRTPQYVPPLAGQSWDLAQSDDELLQEYLSSSREIEGVDDELVRAHLVHMPILLDAGFVEWDRETNIVTQGPRFEEVRPFLELLDGRRVVLPAEQSQQDEPSSRVEESQSK